VIARNGSELLSKKRRKREKVFKNLPIISLARIWGILEIPW
jgi:hypothetical protein